MILRDIFKKSNYKEPEKATKYFCIGANKTGTTSLEKAFKDFGYKLGNQAQGELLVDQYLERDSKAIIDFCHSAEVFQDAPFSFPFTFIWLHQAFPDAKFILSVRNSSQEWYASMKRFHTKKYGQLPDLDIIKNAKYRAPGYMWKVRSGVFGITEDMDMYDENTFIKYYESHNYNVRQYFKNNPNFLEINLSENGAYKNFCNFLNKPPLYDDFPWENKSKK